MKNIKEFIPLWNLVKKERKKIIVTSIILLVASITGVLHGYLVGKAIESVSNGNIYWAIIYLAILFVAEICFSEGLQVWAKGSFRKIENKLSNTLGYNTYVKTLNLPAYAFEEKKSGEIINRITNDTDTLSNTLSEIIDTLSYIITSIIITIYIINNSMILFGEIIIFLIIFYFILKKYNPIFKKKYEEQRENQDHFTSIVNESVRGIREVKTLGIKKSLISDASSILKSVFNKSAEIIDLDREYDLIVKIIRGLLEVGVFITCAILLYNKQIPISFFVAMTWYIYQYMWLIQEVQDLTKKYNKLVVSLRRVNEILDNKLYKDDSFGNLELKKINGVIEFKNVTFGYPNEGITLKDFNIKILPNKKVAIVGVSGQGKSTIFNLLTRIFDVSNGEILIDGYNIKELTEDSLRNSISIIRQEPFIFNRSIFENFLILDPNITLNQVRKYTKMAYLDNYIMSLPDKYNTILGESGINLSGGQKQRLAIARTLAKKSKIILFDEATSSLDNNSQEFIKKSIDNLIPNHTIIIVAHRLSTIIDADVIYVIDKGKIVASGTHRQLLKSSIIYNNLYVNEEIKK